VGSFKVSANGIRQTGIVAGVLARRLGQGDAVLISGALGSGKTAFVKAVAGALGSPDMVTSPTFTLAQFYSTKDCSIIHIDAYRLSGVPEFRDLALDEYIDTSIALVEWGEIIAEDFPGSLLVTLQCPPGFKDLRQISFSAESDRWESELPLIQSEALQEISRDKAVV
jgi:tRNA threonylcarbamoyladenosine biosynthesis protein TsaE